MGHSKGVASCQELSPERMLGVRSALVSPAQGKTEGRGPILASFDTVSSS